MRQDLAKVICEKERKGSRDYMGGTKGYEQEFRYRNREDRDEEYADLDCLPKQESMTRRLRAGGTRNFSENLGALRGLIAKNVGKNWDKLYSAICAQVSPTGTNLERHVHQHLPDFIYAKTRMGEHGVEVFTVPGSFDDGWEPITKIQSWRRAAYYVHPVTRCIVKIKTTRKKVDFPFFKRPKPPAPIHIDALHQLHFINQLWWLVTLAPIPAHCYKRENIVSKFDDKTVFYRTHDYIELPSADILVPGEAITGRYRAHQLKERYGRAGVYGVRKTSASHRVLKQHKVAA